MNLEGLEPELDKDNRLVPLTAYGVKAMSMGSLVPKDNTIAWRGLMVQKAMNQLLFEVAWPKLDLLVLDLPPGTGDVQLTITQSIELAGAVIVSTPQEVALRDAVRGVDLFRKVNVPILGLVQNMSTFVCTNCGHEHDIFGLDGKHFIFQHCTSSESIDETQVPNANVASWGLSCLAMYHCTRRSVQTLMLANLQS